MTRPHWLTSQERRESGQQKAGSIVVAFKSKSDYNKAINGRMSIYGVSCKSEAINYAAPTYQCKNCQEYGHPEVRCRAPTKCRICSEKHLTKDHTCQYCPSKGKLCGHKAVRCANCQEAHMAGSLECPVYIQVQRKFYEASEQETLDTTSGDNMDTSTPVNV